tara:strand:- start:152 stop:400 length:249 start_codon:yes stop_codon:yes gene_type:complete
MVDTCEIDDPVVRQRCQEWLRSAVRDVGITQAELGRRVGLTRLQVNRLLTGKRRWDSRIIVDLSRSLRVPPPDISETNREAF